MQTQKKVITKNGLHFESVPDFTSSLNVCFTLSLIAKLFRFTQNQKQSTSKDDAIDVLVISLQELSISLRKGTISPASVFKEIREKIFRYIDLKI